MVRLRRIQRLSSFVSAPDIGRLCIHLHIAHFSYRTLFLRSSIGIMYQ